MTTWQEQVQAYQQAMAGVTAADINNALDAMDNQFDNGNIAPLFVANEENVPHQVRILPNFETPSQWWLDATIHNFHPQGLKAGFSPKMTGGEDPFEVWLRQNIPYDEAGQDPVQKGFKGCFGSRRALAWVLIRTHHKDIDNGKLYVWSMPVAKGGFKHVIEPVIRQWGIHMMQQVDVYAGREAQFYVVGKNINRSLANFAWCGDPCMAADQNTLAQLFETQYAPLRETFRQLTEADMQQYVTYYEPILEAFMDSPQLAAQLSNGPKDRGARSPNARAMSLQYLAQKGKSFHQMPQAQQPQNMTPPHQGGVPAAPPTQMHSVMVPPSPATPQMMAPPPSVPAMPQAPAPPPPAPPAHGQMPAMPPTPQMQMPHVPQMPMTAPTGAPPAPPMPGMPMTGGAPTGPPMPQPATGGPPQLPPMPPPPPQQ